MGFGFICGPRLEVGAVTSPRKSVQLAARSSGESLTSLCMSRPRLGCAIRAVRLAANTALNMAHQWHQG